jgi:hypothetical protein
MKDRTIAALMILMVLGAAGTARAQTTQPQPRSKGHKLAWTLAGVAAGAAAGFLIGFRAYDDATYAESKIAKATAAGGAVGGAMGFTIGSVLARTGSSASLGAVRREPRERTSGATRMTAPVRWRFGSTGDQQAALRQPVLTGTVVR